MCVCARVCGAPSACVYLLLRKACYSLGCQLSVAEESLSSVSVSDRPDRQQEGRPGEADPPTDRGARQPESQSGGGHRPHTDAGENQARTGSSGEKQTSGQGHFQVMNTSRDQHFLSREQHFLCPSNHVTCLLSDQEWLLFTSEPHGRLRVAFEGAFSVLWEVVTPCGHQTCSMGSFSSKLWHHPRSCCRSSILAIPSLQHWDTDRVFGVGSAILAVRFSSDTSKLQR